MHSIPHIKPMPAKGHGDLDGYGAVCACGTVITSSLETLAREWGRDHVKYYNAKEGS